MSDRLESRESAGPGDLAQPIRRAFADVVKQGALVIGVQPGKIDLKDPGGLDGEDAFQIL